MNGRLPLNTPLVARARAAPGVEVAGSLYALPPADRADAVPLLHRHGLWIHADVFADRRLGVSLDLIRDLADLGTAPLDVHLLSAGALDALDAVCRPGVTRVTLPYEGVEDIETLAGRVRAAGPRPWLAVAPSSEPDAYRGALAYVDGLLVMLIEPGTRHAADPGLLARVRAAAGPVGVDGGVSETNLDEAVAAGATYLVIGRRLFTAPRGSR